MWRLFVALSAGACALGSEVESLWQDDECTEPNCAVNALQKKAAKKSECKDAVEGDTCYKNIMWAKHTGIRQHPHWYPGLTSHSSNADFQEIVHSHSPSKCAQPCAKVDGCHTAVKGESCYNDIMWAKHTGIKQHSHWYPGLSPSSSDEEFQASIHSKRPDKCPEPCPAAAAPVIPAEPEPEPVIPPQIPNLQPPPVIEEPEPPQVEEPEPAAEPVVVHTSPPQPEVVHHPAPPPQPEVHHPAPEPEPEVDRYPQCPKHPQAAREACEQQAIQQEQHDREERERAEQEAARQHERETPLDVRHQEIIDEIGGIPEVGGIPEFDDPDR